MFLQFGTVSETAPGKAKVTDIENETSTDWMPILYPFSEGNSAVWSLSVGAKVVFVEDDSGRGLILGQIYDSSNAATDPGAGVVVTIDGLQLSVSSGLFSVGSGALFLVRSDKAEEKIGSLLDLLIAHAHTSAAPGSPTTPPVNVADFTTLKTQISGGALRTTKIKGL